MSWDKFTLWVHRQIVRWLEPQKIRRVQSVCETTCRFLPDVTTVVGILTMHPVAISVNAAVQVICRAVRDIEEQQEHYALYTPKGAELGTHKIEATVWYSDGPVKISGIKLAKDEEDD